LSFNKIHIVFIVTIILVISACSGNTTEHENSIVDPQSKVEFCLKQELSEYYESYEEIRSDLIGDSLVDDSKDSYGKLYVEIFDFKYTQTEADTNRVKQYYFFNGLGPHFQIFLCSKLAQSDTVLTEKQKEYFEFYKSSGETGGFDNKGIAEVIYDMTNEEFESNGVKESTVFYLGHKYIFNRYLTFDHPE